MQGDRNPTLLAPHRTVEKNWAHSSQLCPFSSRKQDGAWETQTLSVLPFLRGPPAWPSTTGACWVPGQPAHFWVSVTRSFGPKSMCSNMVVVLAFIFALCIVLLRTLGVGGRERSFISRDPLGEPSRVGHCGPMNIFEFLILSELLAGSLSVERNETKQRYLLSTCYGS